MQQTKYGFAFLQRKSILLPAALILIVCMLSGCNWLPSAKRVEGTTPADTGVRADSAGLYIRPDVVEDIQVIFTDDESLYHQMRREDYARLMGLLQSAVYDTKWNDSDIMIKMVAPDYMLLLSYTDKDQERPLEEIYIWKEGGRIKFRNVWFLLPVEHKTHLYDLIEEYRQEDSGAFPER